jgi:hypothetical protein
MNSIIKRVGLFHIGLAVNSTGTSIGLQTKGNSAGICNVVAAWSDVGPRETHTRTGYCCWFDVGPRARHFTGYCCWFKWGLEPHTLLGIGLCASSNTLLRIAVGLCAASGNTLYWVLLLVMLRLGPHTLLAIVVGL